MRYAVIAAVTVFTALAGSWITRGGMGWYLRLRVPSWTPSGRVIGAVWTVLYLLAALSAAMSLDAVSADRRDMLAALFGVNAFLNVAWNYLFFERRQIGSAAMEAALLALSIVILMVQIFPFSPLAVWLLAPYLIWVCFATWMTAMIFRLNINAGR